MLLSTLNAYGQIKKGDNIDWSKLSIHDTTTYRNYDLGITISTRYEDPKDSAIQSGYIAVISKRQSKWYVSSVQAFSFREFHKYSDYKITPEFLDINEDGLPELFLFKGYGGRGAGADDQRHFNIYALDVKKRSIYRVKYKDEIVNPVYDKKAKLLRLNYSQKIIYTKLTGHHLILIKEDTE